MDVYVVKKNAIFKYQPSFFVKFNIVPTDFIGVPIFTFLALEKFGGFKQNIADACDEQSISNSSIILLFVLDREKTRPEGLTDLSDDIFLHTWYHDADAGAHNVMLEATAWGLSSNIYKIEDQQAIIDILNLDEETTIPIFAVPVGS